MRLKSFVSCVLGVAVFCMASENNVSLAQSAVRSSHTRPNILYFYVDDMGWGSIGPNGQTERRAAGFPSVRTPNLDQLARQGLNFTRGYGCHVCSPARSSQQTGFHQGHTFADRNDPDNAKKAMRADDRLIGDVLSQAGYATGYWGKWGYGGSKDRAAPSIVNVQTLPTSHGYQHVLAELHHVRAHTFFQPTLWSAPAKPGATGGLELIPNSLKAFQNTARYPNAPALQNHRDYPGTAYCDDSYAFAALDFVRRQGKIYNETGKPFFGLLAVQIPHAPFAEIEQLPEWDAVYRQDKHFASLSPQTRQWMAMVTRIDAHFGNILSALNDPNGDGDAADSISSNTLVVFQSDNGGPSGKNNIELDANGGLRGNKGQIYEGGIRVPLVMRWPAQINATSSLRAGTNIDRVVDVTDLFPTFCELAGAERPLGIDGVSIAPTLRGKGTQRDRDFVIHEAGRGKSSIIRDRFKLVYSANAPAELYDLEVDHSESNNLAAEHNAMVRELTDLLIGERVTEPKGFAVTYHNWKGSDKAAVNRAANWSDYEYSNAGITYTTDDGPPSVSWIARMVNRSKQSNLAIARQDLSVLGLEIRGDEGEQVLQLNDGVELHGRNEIRIGAGGTLDVNHGSVSSIRWIDVKSGGKLMCRGTLNSDVFNSGTVYLMAEDSVVNGDWHQLDDGAIMLDSPAGRLSVKGNVVLSGELEVSAAAARGLEQTDRHDFIRAKHIEGRFDNHVISINGRRFRVEYAPSSVTLVRANN